MFFNQINILGEVKQVQKEFDSLKKINSAPNSMSTDIVHEYISKDDSLNLLFSYQHFAPIEQVKAQCIASFTITSTPFVY